MGSYLYHFLSNDHTERTAINNISITQSQPNSVTFYQYQRSMDYVLIYQDAYIRYHDSTMSLTVDFDAAYLVLPSTCSCIAVFFNLQTNK